MIKLKINNQSKISKRLLINE